MRKAGTLRNPRNRWFGLIVLKSYEERLAYVWDMLRGTPFGDMSGRKCFRTLSSAATAYRLLELLAIQF